MVDFKKARKKPAPQPKRGATRGQPAAQQPAARGNLNRIGALWISDRKTRQGDKYLTGRIQLDDNTEIRLMVFKNGYKEEPRHPDYIIYEPEAPADTNTRDQQAKGKGKADYDDSIPF